MESRKAPSAEVSLFPVWMFLAGIGVTLGWWGLAFFPASGGAAPEWLARTQSVCFGTLPNGLPDTYGWLLLVLGPASLILGLLVAFGGEIRRGFVRLRASTPAMYVLALLAGTLVWETAWVGTRIHTGLGISGQSFESAETGPLPEHYPRGERPAPALGLIDQSGQEVSLASLRGSTVLMTFAFAHCQTVCPVIVNETVEAAGLLASERVRTVIITLDPWRDTPGALPGLAEKWKLPKTAHLLSGEVPAVTAALDRYQVPWKRDEKTGDVSHPGLIYVIDPDGRIAYTFNNPPSGWLVDAVRRILRES